VFSVDCCDTISAMTTASAAQVPRLAVAVPDSLETSQHSVTVRVTHWINALSFLGLLVSGFAILLAHPRFYWGETGGAGTPSLLDLPLPFMKGGPSGWGRNLHFLSAWACVLNGSLYVITGIMTRHFRRNLVPEKSQLAWGAIARAGFKRPDPGASFAYNVAQRLTYIGVVFVLFPLMIWTGLAMSPAIVSVLPVLVTLCGGQESARTVHFIAADLVVLFLIVHIAMVSLAGFRSRVGSMILGGSAAGEKRP
jgi:thiosulfate reductase cytochrome b subunit